MSQNTAVPFRNELYLLAEGEVKENRKFTSFLSPFAPHQLTMSLVQLASKVGRRLIRDADEALLVFVDEEAAALLLSLPNLFWFWRLLELSLNYGCTSPANESRLVSVDEVRTATRLLRYQYECMCEAGGAAPEAVLAVRVARGMMLASMSGTPHVLPNPLFTEPKYVTWVPPQSETL